jgi:hypothetical protein
VITVAGEDGKLVLMDGYLRVEALRRCGKDTVLADIWSCKEDEALARVLSRSCPFGRGVRAIFPPIFPSDLSDRIA